MATADVATLEVLLQLRDQLSGPLKAVEANVKSLGTTATKGASSSGILATGFGKIEHASGKLAGALGRAKAQVGNLLSGPLGFVGLSAGLFSLGGAFKSSIDKATEWGLAIEKLGGLTGDTAQTLSGLLAVTEKYGVSNERLAQITGFTEKTLGLLQSRAGKLKGDITALQDLQRQYGVVLTDTKGRALDFNTVLLHVADYYASNASAASKAALAAKLFGRGYADLIPVLKLGSAGILEAEQAAQQLGLTLTATNVTDLKTYRETMRELGDAVGGLQLQIGLALVPAVKGLATSLTTFIAQNRDNIVNFFKDAAKFAGELGDAISHYVIPFFGAIKSGWDALPAPLKGLLITGFVANKTTKFLFDVSLKDIGGDLIGALTKAGVGKFFVQPVFVTNQIPGGGGLPTPGGGGGGGIPPIGAGTIFAAIAAAAGVALLIASAQGAFGKNPNLKPGPTGYAPVSKFGGPGPTGGLGPTAAATPGNASALAGDIAGTAIGRAVSSAVDPLVAALHGNTSATSLLHEAVTKAERTWWERFGGRRGVEARSAAAHHGHALGARQITGTYEKDLLHHIQVISRSSAQEVVKVGRLEALEAEFRAHGDTKAAATIAAAIKKLQDKAAADAQRQIQKQSDLEDTLHRLRSNFNLKLAVSTSVSVQSIGQKTAIVSRFGKILETDSSSPWL